MGRLFPHGRGPSIAVIEMERYDTTIATLVAIDGSILTKKDTNSDQVLELDQPQRHQVLVPAVISSTKSQETSPPFLRSLDTKRIRAGKAHSIYTPINVNKKRCRQQAMDNSSVMDD